METILAPMPENMMKNPIKELRFGNSYDSSTVVFTGTEKECMKHIHQHREGCIIREWNEDDHIVIDYGNWSTYYFLCPIKEEEKVEKVNVLKEIATGKFHITEFLDKMIENHTCIRWYSKYTNEDGVEDELTLYDIIVGYTMVGEGKYLLHMVTAENVASENDIDYNIVSYRWLDEVLQSEITITKDDQFDYVEEEK